MSTDKLMDGYDIREELVSCMDRLWRYALVLSCERDVAEELVQATCLRAIERSAQFETGTRLDRWLFTILHSIWISEVRSRRVRMGQGFVEASVALAVDGEYYIETRILANQILDKIGSLPEAQRKTVFLAYVEGFAYREVAALLDVPIGTVMSRLAAARAKLVSDEVAAAKSFERND